MQARTCSLALAGAFFGWPYHAGVAAYVQGAHHPISRVYGTSSGAVIATMLTCGIDVAREGLDLGLRADVAGLGGRRLPFLHPRAFLAPHIDELERALPPDAHVRATGRLFITLRQVRTWHRLVISEFPSRAALIDALVGAVAVPGLTVPLVHRSASYGAVIDGGPRVPDDDRPGMITVRVGLRPRPGCHIAPARRFPAGQVLRIASDRQRREMFECGRTDAARYFRRRG